jgi:hypothetical protein
VARGLSLTGDNVSFLDVHQLPTFQSAFMAGRINSVLGFGMAGAPLVKTL